ncbi:hypothetical protein GH714_007007 [Hevea brasiliensis]|uniref:Uncharacterized protein n=1 Tax=Hevea brasiliensis TaxID=3981 RepID=A0A6A6KJS3_HEVBR|nr:hypothetical protein GH714_007007 [Hevea brasiliensis]
MTMVPAQTLSKRKQQQNLLFYGGYAGCGGGGFSDSFGLMSRLEGYDYCISEACLGSDLVPNPPMAEDESRTNSLNEPAGSSSKDNIQEDRDEGWLQLSIGGHTTSHESKHDHRQLDPTATRGGLIELDLLPVHSGIDVAGPSSDFRVIDPPRRPHSGIWFTLQASQNQAQEPFLPQISKSYLRIKDGRMTVRLLMKYLVNKLRLDSESEGIQKLGRLSLSVDD